MGRGDGGRINPQISVLHSKKGVCHMLAVEEAAAPKASDCMFLWVVFWRQSDSVVITILEHEEKEEGDTEMERERGRTRDRKTEWSKSFL